MKNNQFAIVPTPLPQRKAELTQLHVLNDDNMQLSAIDLWQDLLIKIHPAGLNMAAHQQWLDSILATPTLSVKKWLKQSTPLNDQVFYLTALQLLHFEPALDFQLSAPLAAMKKMQLPFEHHDNWDQDAVISAFYLLLNTRGKNGQTLLDDLTGQGWLKWSYELPASQKPLFFNGKPVASFDPEKFIRETVYIQTDLDTDGDGKADLVRADITRPADTQAGLTVPAVFTASPYCQGTNDEWGEKITHQVNFPLKHKTADETAPAEPEFALNFTKQTVKGSSQTASQTFSQQETYTLNYYLAARGYAVVQSAGIGTKDSDGLQTCGSPEQTDSMKAVVEWLHGDRTAFTDRQSGMAIKATWCNGNVGMTGRSYLGTLATAVATTGVAGLKAIVSEAAISNWYDYYRENGLVMAPGGFQGEDADVLAAETFSRTKRPADYVRIENTNNAYLKQLAAAQDRSTGNYNAFWARRNYLLNVDNIKCDVMMVHGLNDWNVKPVNVKNLYDSLQSLPINHKLILHQGQHIYINAFQSLDFSEMVNLWFANELWDQDNHANDLLPNVLVQANDQAETWTAYHNWSGSQEVQLNFTANSLTTVTSSGIADIDYNDHQDQETYQNWCQHPQRWSSALLADENGRFSAHFVTAPTAQDRLLRGTPILHVRMASSADHGLLSARLIDLGEGKRLTVSPQIINRGGLHLAYHYGQDDLREFQLQKENSFSKVISYGHINLQNRHDASTVDDLIPQEKVDLTLALQPIFHRLKNGHQLLLILFGTDYEMSLRGNENISYTIDPNNSWLTLPQDPQ